MSWPTTRRHPRTPADAYPDVRACAIERPTRRVCWWTVADVLLAVVIAVALAAALIYGWELT